MSRILVITSSFPRYRGDLSGSFLFELFKRLTSLGHMVHVVAPHQYRLKKRDLMDSISIHRFTYMYPGFLQTLAYNYSIPENIRKTRLTILQIIPYILFGILKGIKLMKKQRIDVVIAFWTIPQGLMGVVLKMIFKRPLIVGAFPVELSLTISNYRFLAALLKKTFDSSDLIIANSNFTRNLTASFGVSPYKVAVVYPGIEIAKPVKVSKCVSRAHREFNLEKSSIILAVGRIVERKGFEYLIEAMPAILSSVSSAVLVIVGDGPLRSKLEKKTKRLGLERKVFFFGKVPNHILSAIYAISDVFVLPAIVDSDGNTEGLGVVLLEAMSMAKPVVASKVGGIPEVVVDKETGILVQPKDCAEIADATARILLNREMSLNMGIKGRRRAKRRFSWNTIAEQFSRTVAEVVHSTHTRA